MPSNQYIQSYNICQLWNIPNNFKASRMMTNLLMIDLDFIHTRGISADVFNFLAWCSEATTLHHWWWPIFYVRIKFQKEPGGWSIGACAFKALLVLMPKSPFLAVKLSIICRVAILPSCQTAKMPNWLYSHMPNPSCQVIALSEFVKLPSCRAAELLSCRAAKLISLLLSKQNDCPRRVKAPKLPSCRIAELPS